ncbi:MAG TPA: ABC transporter permease [Gemmataceae bacterium]|jgi:sodium transport system permease protein|nr:ABC transporter permease [Gemmataceae bacterium]
MHWTIVRLIWHRELRDLLRDRRWLFMLLGLPVLLYPVFGLLGFAFAITMLGQEVRVGIAGMEHLPPPTAIGPVGPSAEWAWFGSESGGVLGAAGQVLALRRFAAYPPLLVKHGGEYRFVESDADASPESFQPLALVPLPNVDRGPLDSKAVDVLVSVPVDFRQRLDRGEIPAIDVQAREGDELSKIATRRVTAILRQYRTLLRQTKLSRAGLPPDFDQVLAIRDPDERKPRLERTTDELRDALVRFFPFMLVMWSLAGALYPAIDLCAGEKERGTMETLLISPANRVEIVAGKFLAVWTLATVTAWWNLLWMGGGSLVGGRLLGLNLVRADGLVWCALLTVPLAALFSALCLALGVYARSTKEGQYYLLPIFLGTMPLVLFSLAPGLELTLKTSLIPITGLCLLLQRLIFPPPEGPPWVYFVPVLFSLAVCIAIALRWAVRQFHREDVLFREADRPGWRFRLRRGTLAK